MDLFERQKIQLQHSQQQLQIERQQLHQMHAAAIAAGIEGVQGTPRQTRRSGSGSRSDSPVGTKPVPPSSVPQAVWDNVAHKRSSSDELVLNFRTQPGSGDLASQHIRDPSPKGGGVSRLQRPQSAGARTQALQLAPDASLPLHLMSATNEQRVGGVAGQHTHHQLPMKLASGGGGARIHSGGNKANRSQSLSMPNKLPMKLSSSSSGANLEARSAHTFPNYSSSVMESSAISSVPVSSPATAPASITNSQQQFVLAAHQTPNVVHNNNSTTTPAASAGRARLAGAQQTGPVNSGTIVHPAIGSKRTMPTTQYSMPSGGTPATRPMHSYRSQPAMHLGSGSGSSANQTQSILPMKLAQSGSKSKSSKQSPRSPPQATSPEQKTFPVQRLQQLSSPPENRRLTNSSGSDQLQQNLSGPQSHSQQKPKQKSSEQEIIYF